MECKTKRPDIEQPADPSIRYIALTQGKYAVVDTIHYTALMQWRWYARKVQGKNRWYATRSLTIATNQEVQIQMHRLIMGVFESKIQIDHKSPEETLNNTVANLRIGDASKNQANRIDVHAQSGFKGVHILRKNATRKFDRWIAIITVETVRIRLGIFRDPIPAAHAYDLAAIKYFGEFARINFPEDHPGQGIHRSYPPEHPPAETAC